MRKGIDPVIKRRIREACESSKAETRRLVQELLVEKLPQGRIAAEEIEERTREILLEVGTGWTPTEEERFIKGIIDEITGCGPIQSLLDDPDITEIMVNKYNEVWIEREGRIEKTEVVFDDEKHVLNVIGRIIEPLGRRLDESSPMVDARMSDGSRINAARSPVTIDGTSLTIRKFGQRLRMHELIGLGAITQQVADWLHLCVEGGMNILITGGTGSGKTSMLNCLSAFVPENERIITIEDAAELQLQQPHVVRMETRPPNVEGKGAIGIRQLVINSLRMRPDRIIVGECRGGEALDMLQAMNTGHEGSLTTMHANSPLDGLSRLENLVLMAGHDLPHRVVREMIARAIQIVVHTDRVVDGSRKVTNVSEVKQFHGETIELREIYVYDWQDVSAGKVKGMLKPTGAIPECIKKLELKGIDVPSCLFEGM